MTSKQLQSAAQLHVADTPLEYFQERYRKLSSHYELVDRERKYVLGMNPLSPLASRKLRWELRLKRHFLPHYFGGVPNWRLYLRRLAGRRTLPDFCVIGAPKGGSSDLAIRLLLHPNVLTPLAKEFWNADPEAWRIMFPTEREKRRHTQQHGVAMSPVLIPALHWMELTYSFSRLQPRRKVVITLREPAARVFSQWKWEILVYGRDRASHLPFLATFPGYVDKMLEVYPEYPMFTACGYSALQTSIYWRAVEYWLECFGPDNVLILNVDSYFENPNETLRRIQEFVGLPYVGIPDFASRINENPLQVPPPDPATMTRLREFFHPHNEKLWGLIGQRWNWV